MHCTASHTRRNRCNTLRGVVIAITASDHTTSVIDKLLNFLNLPFKLSDAEVNSVVFLGTVVMRTSREGNSLETVKSLRVPADGLRQIAETLPGHTRCGAM
jgi:hypothetical protein